MLEHVDSRFQDNAGALLCREDATSLHAAIYRLPEATSINDVVSLLHP
jgi:hypothetical protein